jgi:glycosyltransferase involved in cell wall biosynthesis
VRITIVQGAFLPVPPLLGGAVEKVWFNLGKEFARRGHKVTHVSRGFKGLPKNETIDSVHHRRISGFPSPATTPRRMTLDFWYALRAMSQLPPADILVTNTFWLPALEFRRSRGRTYVHVARYPKRQLKLYRNAVLQTVSEPIRQAILAEIPSAADRVRVIAYPLAERYLRPEVGAATKTILYTGRVHPEKGVHLLVQAFTHLSPSDRVGWKLQIVGPSEIAYGGGGEKYLADLRAASAPAGDNVEFVGRVFDENRLIEYYNAARIFVYPSLAERGETFGLSVLEAMAAGCAPLVSDLACFRDFVQPEINGQIFNHRAADPREKLVAALTSMLRDDQSTQRIRQAAWLTARNYTLPKIADQFLSDFEQLCGKPTLSSPVTAAST